MTRVPFKLWHVKSHARLSAIVAIVTRETRSRSENAEVEERRGEKLDEFDSSAYGIERICFRKNISTREARKREREREEEYENVQRDLKSNASRIERGCIGDLFLIPQRI